MKDDVLIILGFSRGDTNSCSVCELRDAIIKLLREDLGLEVLLVGPRFGRTVTSVESGTSPRRPAVLQRLKVKNDSLHKWLSKKAVEIIK